jgi:flagellar basal body P-ring formation protein FlgA
MKLIRFGSVLIALACGFFTFAHAAWPAQARESVQRFLAAHPSLEGREFSVQWTDPRVDLPNCERSPQVVLQGRERAWGQVFLSLRCNAPRTWTRSVSLYVAVKGRYMVAAQPLRSGQILSPSDWQWAQGDLAKMPEAVVDDPEQIKDMALSRPQQAGSPLRLNDFRPMTVIKSGDQVRVTLLGRGFAVSASGQALADAVVGGTVRVRTAEGKILQGTAVSPGTVEVLLE